jgi:hypothetical protein
LKKLATGSSIEKAWEIISYLKEVTKKWPPPVKFVVVLPDPNKVEIWIAFPLQKEELDFIKLRLREFTKGTTTI